MKATASMCRSGFVVNTPATRLVAAYLVGGPIRPTDLGAGAKICSQPAQTGCVVAYNYTHDCGWDTDAEVFLSGDMITHGVHQFPDRSRGTQRFPQMGLERPMAVPGKGLGHLDDSVSNLCRRFVNGTLLGSELLFESIKFFGNHISKRLT